MAAPAVAGLVRTTFDTRTKAEIAVWKPTTHDSAYSAKTRPPTLAW